jgi:hypothetical protein
MRQALMEFAIKPSFVFQPSANENIGSYLDDQWVHRVRARMGPKELDLRAMVDAAFRFVSPGGGVKVWINGPEVRVETF